MVRLAAAFVLLAAAPARAQGVSIFDDAFQNGFIGSWSYGEGTSFTSADEVHSGIYSISFDRIDLEGGASSPQPILSVDDVSLVSPASASASPMQIEHDVTVSGMVSDRFTWLDGAGRPRVAVLAHNDGAAGPGGTRGGELREFRYQTPAGQRVVAASVSAASGFGYVVSHPDGAEACLAGAPDTSALGHFLSGTFTRVFEGRHHAILRFSQIYPRYCGVGAAPTAPYSVPVTMEWLLSTGRDNPLWAVTWDLSAVPADRLMDDSRAPYGELLFDGSATEDAHSVVAGVAWGDRYKFASTTTPVTLSSAWTWNVPNTVPYVKLWTTAVDATMGTVQTQTIAQQDAGGYWGSDRWGRTSADGNACGATYRMPCDYNWPFQSINYSFADAATATNNTRLAWGTNFGFLGQAEYLVHGSASYGGPLPDTSAPGWPKKSYSTYVVLGTHSSTPVEAQVTQVETVQSLTLSANTGSVVTSGPAGAARADNVTYTPAGYNHVYGALAFAASDNSLDANIAVGAGTLKKALVIVGSYTLPAYPTVRLGGVTLVPDVDYFPSLRAGAAELWITLNVDLVGPTNHLEVLPACGQAPAPTIQASGPTTFCPGGSVMLTASIAPGPGVSYLWSPGGAATRATLAAASGSYSVQVTVNGCAGSSPATVVTVDPIPATPVIVAPASAVPLATGLLATVTSNAGSTYAWGIANGAITAGEGTSQVTFSAGPTGPVGLTVKETNASGCLSAQAAAAIPVSAAVATRFFSMPPCRLFDTRNATGPDAAWPALAANQTRTFAVGVRCALPSTAKGISVNQTVAGQLAAGELLLYRGDLTAAPTASSLAFRPGITRANNGILELARDGSGTFKVLNSSTGTVDFILDANGYFQ